MLIALTIVVVALALASFALLLFRRMEQENVQRAQQLELQMRESQAAVAKEQVESFINLAQSHLKSQTDLGEAQLKARQEAIDTQLEGIGKELKSVQEYVARTDKQQAESLAKVTAAVNHSKEVTEMLRGSTQKLSEAMSGGQSRGRWGEQVAEDVLRLAGFVEGQSYRRQHTTEGGSRPDFTFLLPDERILNMDVKMPMAAFTRYLEAENDAERDACAKEFLRDAKLRIKEVTTRDYINPAEGTLDYTLVFIPNEQVYGFIHEQDSSIVEFALENHVVICSPLTLFAVLEVIRQSADNFRLEARTREIQAAIGDFRKQWEMYKAQMAKVGNALGSTTKNWDELTGTRERQLDRAIEKVDRLRREDDEQVRLAAPDVEPDVLSLLPGEDA